LVHHRKKPILASLCGTSMSFEPDLWPCSKSLGDFAPADPAVAVESFQIAQTLKIANPLEISVTFLLPVLAGLSRKCLIGLPVAPSTF